MAAPDSGRSTVDAATVLVALAAILPYCDVLQAHLADAEQVSNRVAAAIIDRAQHMDRVIAGDRALAPETARMLSELSTALLGEIQLEDTVVQMMCHIGDSFGMLQTQLRDLYDHASGAIDAQALCARLIEVDRTADRHVMHSQRVAHATATGRPAPTDDLAPIELF